MSYQFKGKLLKLVIREKRLPDGQLSRIEVVEHPGAVLIVPFLDADRIVFLRQYRPVLNQYLFELPAGTLNADEKPLSCAFRELIEETGYQAKKMVRLGKIFPVPGYSTEVISIYQAQQLTPFVQPEGSVKIGKDPDEIISVRIVKKSEVKTLFSKGRINDAKTICGLVFSGVL